MTATKWLIAGCVVLLTGCHVSDSAVPRRTMPLAVDVAPMIGGDWYAPPLGVTWQWQLQVSDEQPLNTDYDVALYGLDLFDTSEATIKSLQAEGRKVICYFSAGSHESFREDKVRFNDNELGHPLVSWPDERWLDIRSANVHRIMQDRLDLAVIKGCDGVDPDNVDGYLNDSGFDFTASDQLAYNRFIANEAHRRGLAVGLKNDLEQIPVLVDYYDFSVNEQCFQYDECELLAPFIEAGKPVLNAEYPKVGDILAQNPATMALCDTANSLEFSTLILPVGLDDAFRIACQPSNGLPHAPARTEEKP
jgi:hypothetical protein